MITGANRGIGRAFAAGFAATGAREIYAAARDPMTITDPQVQPVRLDITDFSQVATVAAACRDVNMLVNNAGVTTFSPFLEAPDMTSAPLETETDYFGRVSICRAFAPILLGDEQ